MIFAPFAYELGIAPSTVKVLLWRAAAKLGVRTRSEILALPDSALESPLDAEKPLATG